MRGRETSRGGRATTGGSETAAECCMAGEGESRSGRVQKEEGSGGAA